MNPMITPQKQPQTNPRPRIALGAIVRRLTVFNLMGLITALNGFSPLIMVAQSQSSDTPTSHPELISPTTKIDYTPLKNLLATQQWRKANEATLNLMLEAANRDRQGWLTTNDLQNFACWDLQMIDDLWKTYSKGHFGFSVQFPIYIATGNRPGRLVGIDAYEKFGDQVGWRTTGGNTLNQAQQSQQWIIFKENFTYSLDAPVGHLPNPRQEYDITGSRLGYTSLSKRLIECKIVNPPA